MNYRASILSIPPYHAGKKSPGTVKLSSNENPLGPSPRAIEAVIQETSNLHTYPNGAAHELKQAISEHYGIPAEWIVLGNGSDEIFSFAAGLVIEPGDCGVTAKETFSQYFFALSLFGGKTIQVPLKMGFYDLDKMLIAIKQNKAKIVYICNPNNPTGTWLDHDKIVDFIHQLDPSVLVVLDEAYSEYADDPSFPRSIDLVKSYPQLVVTHTFSKIYGIAGLRVGYGIAQSELANKLDLLRSPFNINSLGQVGALKALEDFDFVKRSLLVNQNGKERIQKICSELQLFHYPTQGNFFCINLSQFIQADFNVYNFFRDRGVSIRDLTSFQLAGWIRVTVGTNEQIDILEKALLALVS